MHTFISGGCKNGKSLYAQHLARQTALQLGKPLYYLATMIPSDEEDLARIRRHQEERQGWGFDTIEQGRHICGCLEAESRTVSGRPVRTDGVFLLDSVTALLSNEMFLPWGEIEPDSGQHLAEELTEFIRKTEHVIFVSDFIYSDARRFDRFTQLYRKNLALIDRRLAALCDQVIEVTYGIRYFYKGKENL